MRPARRFRGHSIETHPLLPSGQVLFTPTPRSRRGQHQA